MVWAAPLASALLSPRLPSVEVAGMYHSTGVGLWRLYQHPGIGERVNGGSTDIIYIVAIVPHAVKS